MPKITDAVTHENLVCPFCSLHCDDIKLDLKDNKLYLRNEVPKSCKDKFEKFNQKSYQNQSSKIKGKICSNDEASNYAKRLLSQSKETIIYNSSSDVNITRELLHSASKINAIIDHANSPIFLKNVGIFQRRGYMATSLTEIKNKSDVVILFSNKILNTYPRLLEKFLVPKNSFSINSKNKKIYIIGDKKSNVADCKLKDKRITFIDFNNKNIPLLLDSLMKRENISELNNTVFSKLSNDIIKSKYLSVLWATSEYSAYKECDQIIHKISDYVVAINEETRAGCLCLAGNDGDVSAIQTLGWMTGFPSRIKFTGNYFEYDKDTNNARHLISLNSCDLVLHINVISEKKLILNKKQKNIVIGRLSTKFNIDPDVFIPCGVPGIDYPGHVFRTDNVVSLPLTAVKIPNLKSTQEILREII
ncbi:MAG: hypothetical protein VX093_02485 [Pseudomonadota bacterium]|nr:hypothetical protein [Pseudomonadota bacterium]